MSFDPQKFLENNNVAIDAVLGTMQSLGLDPAQGEQVMLWCVGLSLGWRQAALAGTDAGYDPAEILTRAWQLAAADSH